MVENLHNLIWASEGKNDFLLPFLTPRSFSGLHTKCSFAMRWRSDASASMNLACVGGLPTNLLLLGAIGVAITVAATPSLNRGIGDCTCDARHTLCGSHTNDCRPIIWLVLSRALELLSGVVLYEFCLGEEGGKRSPSFGLQDLMCWWRWWFDNEGTPSCF